MTEARYFAEFVVLLDKFFPVKGLKSKKWSIFRRATPCEIAYGVPSCTLQDICLLPDLKQRTKRMRELLIKYNLIVIENQPTGQIVRMNIKEFRTYCHSCHGIILIEETMSNVFGRRENIQWRLKWGSEIFRSFDVMVLICERCCILTLPEYDVLRIFPDDVRRLLIQFIEI
jgi:hypothetical protein